MLTYEQWIDSATGHLAASCGARPAHRHKSAGSAGIHHLLGAQLARYERIAAFETILARMDKLAYARDRNSFQHYPHPCLCGLKKLWITFDKTSKD